MFLDFSYVYFLQVNNRNFELFFVRNFISTVSIVKFFARAQNTQNMYCSLKRNIFSKLRHSLNINIKRKKISLILQKQNFKINFKFLNILS